VHGWTYSSHPLCTAAGVANFELVDELARRGGHRRRGDGEGDRRGGGDAVIGRDGPVAKRA
jgi:hypothetical protein